MQEVLPEPAKVAAVLHWLPEYFTESLIAVLENTPNVTPESHFWMLMHDVNRPDKFHSLLCMRVDKGNMERRSPKSLLVPEIIISRCIRHARRAPRFRKKQNTSKDVADGKEFSQVPFEQPC